MLALEQTKAFKKCLKKYRHKKSVLKELKAVVEVLVNEKSIPQKYRDHDLKGNHKGIRELHLKPDDLLLYVKITGKTITLAALGSHAELF
jgi:mRNA interferase YafQ